MSAQSKNLLIAGNQLGLERDIEPFLLPEGAYPILENAFIFRQRVKRKRGLKFFGRLRRVYTSQNLTQTTTAGVTTNIADLLADASINVRSTEPNGEIQIGSVTISVADGNPSTWDDSAQDGTLTATGGNASGGTINYVTGAITLTFTAPDAGGNTITVSFGYFPTLPVMGLPTQENPLLVNRESTIGFDTKYAYTISAGQWVELSSTTPTTWQGDDSQFFWSANYFLFGNSPNEGVYFFVTNFNYNSGTPANSDPIRYYNNTTWTALTPQLDAGGTKFLLQCRILIPFKGRLLAFNTVEGTTADFAGTNTRQPQRLRFSQVGDPTTTSAWQSDVSGLGGFIDAPTGEAIVSAVFLKDNLIVYFERSSWIIDYTGDPTTPFLFRKINNDLGAEGSFSTWSFDDYALGVGDIGFHKCNGYNTQRFDQIIPDEIFKFQNLNDGPERIYAVRDYWNELVYFTYPQEDIFDEGNDDQKFPNRVLVYNYRNNSWSKFSDSFTCYGYFQRSSSVTWSSATWSWEEATWSWQGDIEKAFIPIVMAGNQQGYTLIQQDRTSNQKTLTIQDLSGSTVTCVNHNLRTGDYVVIENVIGTTISPVQDVYQIQSVTDSDNFVINATFTGTYLGGGEITVLQNFRVATKRFNPFLNIRNTARLTEVDFFLDRTDNGEFEVQMLIDENTSLPMPTFSPFDPTRRMALPANRQNNIVLTRPETGMTFQANQEKIWHPRSFSIDAQFFQLTMTLSDAQIQDLSIYRSDFVLHALLFCVSPSGRLVL